jgi:dienelactone hydrolase
MSSHATDRARLWSLLGRLPPWPAEAGGELLEQHRQGNAHVEHWRLDLNPREPVPALLSRPVEGPVRGVVLHCHAHGHRFDIGKGELVTGRPSLQPEPYAEAFAAHGFAALAIDHWGFGERAHTTERKLVKRCLWEGTPLWGLRVYDTIAAVSWLRGREAFRDLPLVAFGMSMGSTLAFWAAALDPRIDAVVEMCCLAEFQPMIETGAYDLHGDYYFVPGLLPEFTAAAINALIVPRPHLSIAGATDPMTPPAALEAIDAALRSSYVSAGAGNAWRQSVHPGGHAESPAMRNEVLAFVDAIADGGAYRNVIVD